jgi:pyridoxal 5'-phosphate synthase pdxT subunit
LTKIDDKIVGVRQNNIIATAFHPELSGDTRFHREFIKSVVKLKYDREK